VIALVRCYAAAIPFIVWALMLAVGIVDDDSTRIPFLIVEAVAITITVRALAGRYRDSG
jgi:hypothetical protein